MNEPKMENGIETAGSSSEAGGYNNTVFSSEESTNVIMPDLRSATEIGDGKKSLNAQFTPEVVQSFQKMSSSNKLYFGLTLRQLHFMGIFGIMNIFRAVAVLINGPFFPPEAEKRGTTATEIGFIFASFDYTIIVASILYGKYIIKSVGPVFVVKLSILNTGLCTILFGCMAFIDDHDLFVTLCFLIRILGGAGDAGLYPSLFTILAIEFPELVSSAIGLLEVFFGIGAIIGPIVCGALIDIIGYTWVYSIVGICILLTGMIAVFFLPSLKENPNIDYDNVKSSDEDSEVPKKIIGNKDGFLEMLKIRTVLMAIFGLFVAASSIGFITATLELHMEEFDLTSTMTGAVFSVGTLFYVVFSMVWGFLSDKTKTDKNFIVAAGALFVALGFSFLGPLPFLPWEKSLWAVFVGYSIHGIGIGGSIMSGYAHALGAAMENGFADNSATYSLVSGVYTCTFSLGNAVGPSIGGVLFDSIGFRWGTLIIIGLSVLVAMVAVLLSWIRKRKLFMFSQRVETKR